MTRAALTVALLGLTAAGSLQAAIFALMIACSVGIVAIVQGRTR